MRYMKSKYGVEGVRPRVYSGMIDAGDVFGRDWNIEVVASGISENECMVIRCAAAIEFGDRIVNPPARQTIDRYILECARGDTVRPVDRVFVVFSESCMACHISYGTIRKTSVHFATLRAAARHKVHAI